jgi:hypothetical protein
MSLGTPRMSTFIVIATPCFALAILIAAILLAITDLQYIFKDERNRYEHYRHDVSRASGKRPRSG